MKTTCLKNKFDILIVGHGIAGAVLSRTLAKEKLSVAVADTGSQVTSSRVCTGLFNPVVFKRITKSWRIDEVLPVCVSFYREMERQSGLSLLTERQLIKVFTSVLEREQWLKRSTDPEMSDYLGKNEFNGAFSTVLQIHEGMAVVNKAGNVMVQDFLDWSRKQQEESNAYFNGTVNYRDITIDSTGVFWNNLHAGRIIFCEGMGAEQNPFFPPDLFKPAKGELLTVEIPELNTQAVINKGVFLLPSGKNSYRVGATYAWDRLDAETTPEGRYELEERLKKVIRVPFRVTGQQAGVRPATYDRRPVVGQHHTLNRVFFFNGFGTKGTLLAPWLAEKLYRYIYHAEPLPEEVYPYRKKN